jgi:uncharacterized protein
MKVRLQEINDKPTHFSFRVPRKELEKLEERFEFETLECEAKLTTSSDFIDLKGHYQVRIKTFCDFCLESVTLGLDESFRLDLVAEDNQQTQSGDIELTMDSPELDYYRGDEIHLTRYFEDQLILDLPLNISCSEDCRGLCPVCGCNLNHEQCDCPEQPKNSPFAVLKDLKSDS